MPKYIVFFQDREDYADQRQKHMEEHLTFLERNSELIVAAGPLIKSDSGTGAGGMWLVEADDSQDILELIHAAPFWPTGLRKEVNILIWNQVFREGRRLIAS